jgi:8-oxo-dGTP pyrophosphatase MutT (NUDIX family)
MKRLLRIVLGILLMVIGAMFIVIVFVPGVRASPPLPEWVVTPAPSSAPQTWAAGCFIQLEGGVVLTISQHGTIQLPFGRAKDGDETPRETAARETLEETGLTVAVHEVVSVLFVELRVDGGHDTQHLLYRCTTEPIAIEYENLDVSEVAEVLVINPVTMRTPSGRMVMAPWRFPQDRDILMFLLQGGP